MAEENTQDNLAGQIQEGNTSQLLPYHTHNGVDSPVITVSESSLNLSDITTGDATTARHGLLPKLSGVATEFLDGTGDYDTVKDSDLSTSDITTNNSSSSKHGFLAKLTNDTTLFMRADGAWADPLSLSYIKNSFTAGEAITSGNAVVIGSGSTYNHITQGTIDNTPDVSISSNEMAGQTFTTPSSACTLGSIRLYNITRLLGGSMDFNFDIYATSGGLPTGASLGSSDSVSSHAGGDVTVAFSTAINLAASTVYAFVINTSQNYEVNTKDTTNPYTGGQAVFSSNSGSTWAAWASGRDLEFDLNLQFFPGYIYQSSAASSNARANNFLGIAIQTITAFNTGTVAIDGYITGLSGLTKGQAYLSDTLGAISSSAGTQSRKIGLAPTTTTFLIKHDNP